MTDASWRRWEPRFTVLASVTAIGSGILVPLIPAIAYCLLALGAYSMYFISSYGRIMDKLRLHDEIGRHLEENIRLRIALMNVPELDDTIDTYPDSNHN